jgi:outer membrane protein assembly factor BamB
MWLERGSVRVAMACLGLGVAFWAPGKGWAAEGGRGDAPAAQASAGERGLRPVRASRLDLAAFRGMAVGADGSIFTTGVLVPPTRRFDGIELTASGGGNAFVGSHDPVTGRATWARRYGSGGLQEPTGIAVSSAGVIALAGSFTGSIEAGRVRIANGGPGTKGFLLGLRARDGEPEWARSVDLGADGAIVSVAGDPRTGRIAVCGYASRAATDLVPGAQYHGGARDAVLAVFDSDGRHLWSRQLGGPQEEDCTAVAFGPTGDVYAAGRYDGALSITDQPLPVAGSRRRGAIWTGRFEGRTGAPLAQAGFGDGGGSHRPYAVAVGPSGEVYLCGSMTGTLSFGGRTSRLTSAGSVDAFVARLDPSPGGSFQGAWSVRLGGVASDEARALALGPSGDVAVAGFFEGSATGAARLEAAASGPSDAFLLILDGSSGATLSARAFGDRETQAGLGVAYGRAGEGEASFLALAGDFVGRLDLGAAGTLEAVSGAAFLAIFR